MTKRDYLDAYLQAMKSDEIKDIEARLDALVTAERITTGAAYYVYVPYQWMGYKWFQSIFDDAIKDDHTKYNTRINHMSIFRFTNAWEQLQKDKARALAFIEEQENCTFEESQKQVLLREESEANADA